MPLENLNDELKDLPALADFTDINALAQSFIDTKSMVGKMVRIPGEDASAEDQAAFKQKLIDTDLGVVTLPDADDEEGQRALNIKLGMPEEAAGYSEVEGMTEDRFKSLARFAHDAGISDKQFQKVAKEMMTLDGSVADAIVAQREAGLVELKTEWGEAYVEKTARAQRLAEATKAPQKLLDALKGNGVDATTLIWLDAVATSLGGEGAEILKQLGEGGITADTRAELEAQRDELNRKLINDDFPPEEYRRLQQKLIGLNEKLVKAA